MTTTSLPVPTEGHAAVLDEPHHATFHPARGPLARALPSRAGSPCATATRRCCARTTMIPRLCRDCCVGRHQEMMNVYDEAVAPEKRTAHEELLQNLSRRTAKRTAEDAIFVSV